MTPYRQLTLGIRYGILCLKKAIINRRLLKYLAFTNRPLGEILKTGSVLTKDQPIVDDRSRVDDWPARPHSSRAGGEADTIIGKAHIQVIVSLTERKSGLALIYKMARRTNENTEDAM